MPHAYPTSVGSYTAVDRNTYTYDRDSSNGNTTQDDLGHTLVYDAWNHLTQVKDASLTLKTYIYDALVRRTTETAPLANPTELFYSAQWQVIEEDTGASRVTLQSQTVYSPVYSDAIVLRDYDFNFNGATSFSITERVYATQDANFNVTGLVTFHTLTHTISGDIVVGDTNGDATVNVSDLGNFATFNGKHAAGGDAVGDFNHDGVTDVPDLGTLATYYGDTHSTFTQVWQVGERVTYDAYGTFTAYNAANWTARTDEYLGWRNFHQGLRIDRNTGNSVSGAWVVGTGDYDNRFRITSATMGRALTKDPSGYPDGLDPYVMYGGNPINRVDPTGLGFMIIPRTVAGRKGYGVAFKPDSSCPCGAGGTIKIIQAIQSSGTKVTQSNFDINRFYGVTPRIPPPAGSNPLGYVEGGGLAWTDPTGVAKPNGAFLDAPVGFPMFGDEIDMVEVVAVCTTPTASTIISARRFSFNEVTGELKIENATTKPTSKIWENSITNWKTWGGGYTY